MEAALRRRERRRSWGKGRSAATRGGGGLKVASPFRVARSHGVTSRSVVDRETTTDARGTRLLDPNAECANIDARHARATRKNRSSGLKDRAKTSLSIPFHPSNSSSKPREGKKTRGDEKSSTRLSSPDLGKVQIIFISMECGGEGARLECKYGEGEKSSFRLATPK